MDPDSVPAADNCFLPNSYQWCGHNTFEGSGYEKLVEDYNDYSLPVFFTEFSCSESPHVCRRRLTRSIPTI
jgi:hypothetical protein